MDQVELEDGELSNDSSDNTYTPLERPANYSQVQPNTRFPVVLDSESEEELESNDSDSDSDVPVKKMKKPKLKIKPVQRHVTKKKYDIWSARAKCDLLSETLNNCDVSTKDKSRNPEYYDHTLAYRMNENVYTKENNKRSRSDRNNVNFRQRQRSKSREKMKSAARCIGDLVVTLESSVEDIAKDIANKLLEEKDNLVLKVVETMGKKKSIEIFKETQSVEAEGGMLIMNQTRRRTPGGVFLYLVRNDYHITFDQKKKIFGEDRSSYYRQQKEKKKLKNQKLKIDIAISREKMLPDLLTRAELLTADSNRSRKVTDGSEHVINPPPTPETDNHENSGDGMDCLKNINYEKNENTREIPQTYDDDFLDIGNSNEMDLF